MLVSAVLGACGGSSAEEPDGRGASMTVSAAEVMDYFSRETGLSLRKQSQLGTGPGIVMLGSRSLSTAPNGDLVTTPDPLLTERFGDFSIFVYEDVEQARAFRRGEPDESDPAMVWREHPPEHEGEEQSWSVRKLYRNVELVWFSGKRVRDHRWTALDRVLTSMLNAHE
jgi:hypothetical protein